MDNLHGFDLYNFSRKLDQLCSDNGIRYNDKSEYVLIYQVLYKNCNGGYDVIVNILKCYVKLGDYLKIRFCKELNKCICGFPKQLHLRLHFQKLFNVFVSVIKNFDIVQNNPKNLNKVYINNILMFLSKNKCEYLCKIWNETLIDKIYKHMYDDIEYGETFHYKINYGLQRLINNIPETYDDLYTNFGLNDKYVHYCYKMIGQQFVLLDLVVGNVNHKYEYEEYKNKLPMLLNFYLNCKEKFDEKEKKQKELFNSIMKK